MLRELLTNVNLVCLIMPSQQRWFKKKEKDLKKATKRNASLQSWVQSASCRR